MCVPDAVLCRNTSILGAHVNVDSCIPHVLAYSSCCHATANLPLSCSLCLTCMHACSNEIDKELLRAHDLGEPRHLFEVPQALTRHACSSAPQDGPTDACDACQVMEHHGEEFNQINVSTTFKHLADLVEKKPDLKDEVLGNEKFQTLVGEQLTCLHGASLFAGKRMMQAHCHIGSHAGLLLSRTL